MPNRIEFLFLPLKEDGKIDEEKVLEKTGQLHLSVPFYYLMLLTSKIKRVFLDFWKDRLDERIQYLIVKTYGKIKKSK